MKGWDMIHKIKALYDNGRGLSIRQIARELGIARNTVKKYLRLNEATIAELQVDCERAKCLDSWRDYIVHLLQSYPELSASKIYRKLLERLPKLEISERSVRRYVNKLKEQVTSKQKRYYEPVIDMVPGVQCQVDGGELSKVLIAGEERKIYFVVFVLSYSRLLYVAASCSPINTDSFIQMHDEAFRYFGGMPQECVYDQAKLVVISEVFREVTYNQRFYQYATQINLQPRVCEGYDPESKGKVEAGVKYVKNNFFYGEEFASLEDLRERLVIWVSEVSNKRIHGTTKLIPVEVYTKEERKQMLPYLSLPVIKPEKELRKVDKTSLISYKSNKYSVPMRYQMATVFIMEESGRLFIGDINGGEIIAEHLIHPDKGITIKNKNHYRDYTTEVAEDEKTIGELVGTNLGANLCSLIKQSSPKIYRDQLRGLKKVLTKRKSAETQETILLKLVKKPRLTVSMVQEYLEAYNGQEQRSSEAATLSAKAMPALNKYATTKGGATHVSI